MGTTARVGPIGRRELGRIRRAHARRPFARLGRIGAIVPLGLSPAFVHRHRLLDRGAMAVFLLVGMYPLWHTYNRVDIAPPNPLEP